MNWPFMHATMLKGYKSLLIGVLIDHCVFECWLLNSSETSSTSPFHSSRPCRCFTACYMVICSGRNKMINKRHHMWLDSVSIYIYVLVLTSKAHRSLNRSVLIKSSHLVLSRRCQVWFFTGLHAPKPTTNIAGILFSTHARSDTSQNHLTVPVQWCIGLRTITIQYRMDSPIVG